MTDRRFGATVYGVPNGGAFNLVNTANVPIVDLLLAEDAVPVEALLYDDLVADSPRVSHRHFNRFP